jgi:hypothetical protein
MYFWFALVQALPGLPQVCPAKAHGGSEACRRIGPLIAAGYSSVDLFGTALFSGSKRAFDWSVPANEEKRAFDLSVCTLKKSTSFLII